MPAPAERAFTVFVRGDLREEILAYFRTGLRQMTNPETGSAFAETEIATATALGSSFYAEADAIDLVLLTQQSRAFYFADQVRVDRATTEWLTNYHGVLWGEEYLSPTGGSGTVDAPADPGSIFVGSTTVPDPTATYGTDPAGLRYQVLTTVVTPGSGVAELTLVAIDTGTQTNIDEDTVITWAENEPLGAEPTATVTSNFTGGTNAETDGEFASRLASRIRNKPSSGNRAHFRSWGRESSNAVEDAFIYPCAFHAGSVLVAITQKRAGTTGPSGRVANLATLTAATAYLTPPGSSVVPAHVHVVVTTINEEPADAEIQISMPVGTTSGWADPTPWPGYTDGAGTVASVTNLTTQQNFRIHSDTALPTGVTAPRMMIWNEADSRWEELDVDEVTSFGGGEYTVTLASPVGFVIAVGDYVSPFTERATLIAETIESYFDGLGPGEVVASTDIRFHRAYRFPLPTEEYAQRAGSALGSRISEALGVNAADVVIASISPTTPTIPTTITDGPNQITCGKMAIYSV